MFMAALAARGLLQAEVLEGKRLPGGITSITFTS